MLAFGQSKGAREKVRSYLFQAKYRGHAHGKLYSEKVDQVGFVEGSKRGKELFYAKSEMVRNLLLCYRDSRETCLVNRFSELGEVDVEYLADLVRRLLVLFGLCRQATGSAPNL